MIQREEKRRARKIGEEIVKQNKPYSMFTQLPDSFGKVLFTNAGADAVENALKIARLCTGRQKVISCYKSYHVH